MPIPNHNKSASISADMRVLYIDDDRVNSLLFRETCRLAGCVEFESALSGAEAMELVTNWRPDLLVIDLHLPDTDGYRLLKAMREGLGTPLVPAILCTADEAALVEGPAKAAGFDGCWTKPVEVQAVIDELKRRNQQHQSNAAAMTSAAHPASSQGNWVPGAPS